jgi:hypothetical protein
VEVFVEAPEGNEKLAIAQRILIRECFFDAEKGVFA